jgi:hypothetical protein
VRGFKRYAYRPGGKCRSWPGGTGYCLADSARGS